MIKDKKKSKLKEQNRKLEQNQVSLNRVLDLLGVSELHKTLYRPMREFLVKYPDPPLTAECEGKDEVPEPLMEIFHWWSGLTYKGMSSSDFMTVMRPLIRCICSSRGKEALATPDEFGSFKLDKEFVERYTKPAEKYFDFFYEEFRNLFLFLAWKGNSVDTGYTIANLEWKLIPHNRMQSTIQLKFTPAQSSHFVGRWNYRVGSAWKGILGSGGEVEWLSGCPLDYGLPGNRNERLPIYISDHALDRLRERLDNVEAQSVVMPRMAQSLVHPVVHPLNTPGCIDSLVEFRVQDPSATAGYFVVSRTEKEIFIKTFLFLTMYQTPEGALLHRRLRMARPDYDFHKLERYSTFADTDIMTHPALVPIWEQCGFSGFLKWVQLGHSPKQVSPVADEMARYFNL